MRVDNELTAQADLRGVGFSFNGQPTADDTRKIESVIRLVDKYSDDDDMEQSESGTILYHCTRQQKFDFTDRYCSPCSTIEEEWIVNLLFSLLGSRRLQDRRIQLPTRWHQ